MMKKTLKLASLTFLMFGCAVASEFRPPMAADRGPQRLDMNMERSGDSNWELDMYSVAYNRSANKSFTKHGGKTASLSSLIFGKENFKISEALAAPVPTTPAGNLSTAYSQEFNINLDSITLFPRVTYAETGINMGGKLGYRIWDGKGVLGFKVNVPLKTVRMERDNNAETAEAGAANINMVIGDSFSAQQIPDARTAHGAAALVKQETPVVSNMYRVSFVQNLPLPRAGGVGKFIDSVQANPGAAPGNVNNVIQIGNGSTYGRVQAADNDFQDAQDHAYKAAQALPYAIVYTADTKNPPLLRSRAMALPNQVQDTTGGGHNIQFGGQPIAGSIVDIGRFGAPAGLQAGDQAGGNIGGANDVPRAVTAFPAAAGLAEGLHYVFASEAGNIGDAAAGVAGQNGHVTRDLQTLRDKGNNLWLVTTHSANGTLLDGNTDAVLQQLIKRYGSETAEQWLWRNGYTFANNQRTGLGDITLTPSYEHIFSKAWQGGIYAHVLIPTGGSRKMGENPYKVRLGNDNHVELGGGANVAWQALDWMNVRLDAMAAYALPAKERVAAPFKGATVKAVGPAVDVDIDYTRIKASLDTTMVHPKAAALATTIGYDFEFKTRDNVSLKNKTYTFKTLKDDANSWFGGFWDNAAGDFRAKEVELDGAVLAKDTERISHNLRVESSWHATEQLSIFWGGSAPLFGQNVAKMNTIYGGMNVKF